MKDYALQRYCTDGCMDASQISQCNANIQVTDDDKKRCTTFQSAIVSLLIHIQIIYHDQVSLCVQRYLAQKTLCGSAPFLLNFHRYINTTDHCQHQCHALSRAENLNRHHLNHRCPDGRQIIMSCSVESPLLSSWRRLCQLAL